MKVSQHLKFIEDQPFSAENDQNSFVNSWKVQRTIAKTHLMQCT